MVYTSTMKQINAAYKGFRRKICLPRLDGEPDALNICDEIIYTSHISVMGPASKVIWLLMVLKSTSRSHPTRQFASHASPSKCHRSDPSKKR